MQQFTLIFHGGMPLPKDEVKESISRWRIWFETLGSALIDEGDALKNGKQMLAPNSLAESKSDISGYCVIQAENENDVLSKINECPIFGEGGNIHILTNLKLKHFV